MKNKGGRLLLLFLLLYIAVLLFLIRLGKVQLAAVSAAIAILTGVGIAGAFVGLFQAFRCFMEALMNKHNEISEDGRAWRLLSPRYLPQHLSSAPTAPCRPPRRLLRRRARSSTP